MITRYAEPKDLLDIWRLCWAGYKTLKDVFPETVDPELLMDWIEEAMKQAPCVLLENDREIIGMWGLCTARPKWSRDAILADYMLYIKPGHSSQRGVDLLKKAVLAFADQSGLNFKLSYLFTDKKDAHIRLFEKNGFEVTGVMSIYRGNNGRKK